MKKRLKDLTLGEIKTLCNKNFDENIECAKCPIHKFCASFISVMPEDLGKDLETEIDIQADELSVTAIQARNDELIVKLKAWHHVLSSKIIKDKVSFIKKEIEEVLEEEQERMRKPR